MGYQKPGGDAMKHPCLCLLRKIPLAFLKTEAVVIICYVAISAMKCYDCARSAASFPVTC